MLLRMTIGGYKFTTFTIPPSFAFGKIHLPLHKGGFGMTASKVNCPVGTREGGLGHYTREALQVGGNLHVGADIIRPEMR